MDYSKHNTEKQRRRIRSAASKIERKVGFNMLRFSTIAIVIIVAVAIAALAGGFKGIIDSAPEISTSQIMPSKFKSVMYYPDGTEAVELVGAQSNRTIVRIEDLPHVVPEAFVAIEDERFYEHNGIDPRGIIRAMVVGVGSGNFSEGASTITQQLIKITVFNGGNETDMLERFTRKFQEWYLAIDLEKKLSKDEIMEAYLNTINLGCGAYGIEAAAETYFNKTASELTASEAAVIAGIAQSPTYNNPIEDQNLNAQRRSKILGNMQKLGFISQEEYDTAVADDVYSRIQEISDEVDEASVYTWFEDAVIDQVVADLQSKLGYSEADAWTALYSGGLRIYMTQDKSIQKILDKYYLDDDNFSSSEYLLHWALTYKDKDGNETNIDENSIISYYDDYYRILYSSKDDAKEDVEDFKKELGIKEEDIIAESFNLTVQSQSSFVIMDQHSGKVLALVGGRGPKTENRSFNRATQALRQPGSVFKILAVYLPGLDKCGLTLASTKKDEKYTSPSGYEVNNYSRTYTNSEVTVRKAITNSLNVVTVKFLIEDVTPELSIEYMKKLGITTIDEENDCFAPIGLGGIYNGVSNLELTAAFAAIANKGTYKEPILYTKILDQDGNVLLDNVPETHVAMKETTAWLLTSAMEDVVTYGTGTPAQISEYGIKEAGKTGTTENTTDLWFVGYTPYLTAGIWLGYDNSISMEGHISYDHEEHKYLWADIMSEVLEGYDDADFEMPDNIERATVCSGTGLLPNGACPAVTEYFSKDTIPTEYCSAHQLIPAYICTHCGKLGTSATPQSWLTLKYFYSYSEMPKEYCKHTAADDKKEPETKASGGDKSSGGGN